MHSPQEPVSPSASTASSGSPPPDDIFSDQIPPAAVIGTVQQQLNQTKRRLASSPSQARDIKARRRDDGAKRSFVAPADVIPREGGRREELVDVDLMERLRQEFGDPFDESDLNQ